MPITYEPIQTYTLSTSASTITFNSIPATYTDLRLVVVGKAALDTDGIRIRFNNDTGTNYSWTNLRTNGGTVASSTANNQNALAFLGQSGTGMSNTISSFGAADIINYAASIFKTVLIEDNTNRGASGELSRFVGLYRSTTAISRIDLFEVSANLPSNVTATLYGIKNA
jgi:hypothetical protein